MYSALITLHFISLVIYAGGAIGSLIVERGVWRQLSVAPQQALMAGALTHTLGQVAQAGAGLLLVGGIALLIAGGGGYLAQTWLQVKLGLYAVMALNGALVAKPAAERLLALLKAWSASAKDDPERIETHQEIVRLKQRFGLFHLSQNALLITILVLVSYRWS